MTCAAIGVLDSLTELRGAIADWHPDIVFTCWRNRRHRPPTISTWWRSWNSMRQPYTGAAIPRGCCVA